jgi:hypothetical protein
VPLQILRQKQDSVLGVLPEDYANEVRANFSNKTFAYDKSPYEIITLSTSGTSVIVLEPKMIPTKSNVDANQLHMELNFWGHQKEKIIKKEINIFSYMSETESDTDANVFEVIKEAFEKYASCLNEEDFADYDLDAPLRQPAMRMGSYSVTFRDIGKLKPRIVLEYDME